MSIKILAIMMTTILSGLIIYHFGWTITGLAALIFTLILILLSFIDLRSQCLPDKLTLSLLWIGLLVNMNTLFVPLEEAVLGAMAAYLSLWVIARLFYFLKGKVGIGDGDLKLFAAIGAWLGWQQLPWIMAAASLSGLILIYWLIKERGYYYDTPIPFGPFLAIFGWLALWF